MFSLDLLLNAVVAGILLGGFYAAVSLGISVTFGFLEVANIAHPVFVIAGAYVAYYDAIINASENKAKQLPGMQDVMGTLHRSMVEGALNARPLQPDWGVFYNQIIETDTRLRLASLQIQLRHPSQQAAVPTRLAEVGSQYFDPFTGLPMLWSPTQQKLYSVGKDRLDDGGDPTFDISVPAVVGQIPAKATASPVPTATRSSRR